MTAALEEKRSIYGPAMSTFKEIILISLIFVEVLLSSSVAV